MRTGWIIGLMVSGAMVAPAAALAANKRTQPHATPPGKPAPENPARDIVVTGSRASLLGTARTASDGTITAKEVALRPIYRASQVLEAVPGLVVTTHSGEGKASQYLLRGFNLDHGTDFASFVDDMPINRPTNTHGQGYSDQNFIIPSLIGGIDFTKGPYHADVGDFGAVGSAHLHLVDQIPTTLSLSAGTLGDYAVSGATTIALDTDRRVLLAGEYSHLDGPWTQPEHFNKYNLAARFSQGSVQDGVSVTALAYSGGGNLTTDQPLRAVQAGLIDRFGTLDPSDGSRAHRLSISAHLAKPLGTGGIAASVYGIRSGMTLWNNFTHYLDDPINGDQEEQFERRDTVGGQLAYHRTVGIAGLRNVVTIGTQVRYDSSYVARLHTQNRVPLATCSVEGGDAVRQVPAAGGICNADDVTLLDLGGYGEIATVWTPWLRSTLGVREEYYRATDASRTIGVAGRAQQTLFQPKASIAIGPFARTELYVSAGRGFHSDDVRGVFGTVPQQASPGAAGPPPLLARATGYEIGLRSNIVPHLSVQLAAFRQDFQSELAYNADIGQDSASAPSRRDGIEISGQYRPLHWLELTSDLAFVRARYRGDLAAFDLDGAFIANAPRSTLSFGALISDLGRWFGGIQLRNLGAYPLVDGPHEPRDPGYSEVNLDIGRRFGRHAAVELSVFNLFDTHANASAYFYTTRLQGEPAEGVAGFQAHPLEPRSARVRFTESF